MKTKKMTTTMTTPMGKLMYEKQLFESVGNWDAAERIQNKINQFSTEIKERKPLENERIRSEYENPIPCFRLS